MLRLNKLFDIESELEQLEPEDRKNQRILREKRLLEDFWSWAEKNAVNVLPKSKLSTAFHYALNNRQEFFNYLEDGNCSINGKCTKTVEMEFYNKIIKRKLTPMRRNLIMAKLTKNEKKWSYVKI